MSQREERDSGTNVRIIFLSLLLVYLLKFGFLSLARNGTLKSEAPKDRTMSLIKEVTKSTRDAEVR